MTSCGVGPRKTNTSSRPDSEIQWVSVLVWEPMPKLRGFDEEDDLVISIHVSAAFSQNTPTVESFLWACMKGMAPYKVIGLSISYSNTSEL